MITSGLRRLCLLGSLVTIASCSDAGLQPAHPQGPPGVDNLMSIDVEACTSPAADSYFPVKILFLVDTSDSMSVTDRGNIRAQAVAQVLNRYAGNPSVEFGVIAFDAKLDVLTNGFTNTPDIATITTRLSEADRLTDYQGALGAAYTMLSQDMQASSPADRARTKYVVVFFSDGTPDPQCSSTMPSPYLICTVPKEDWQTAFDPPLDPSLYPELVAGGDYNQPAQILRGVNDIVALEDYYHVGEVRLHTGFLFDPSVASDPLAIPFNLNRAAGEAILTSMAMAGGGTFTEFSSGTQINFLNINYTSIKEPYALAELIANNNNAQAGTRGLLSDTDGDGLPDDDEAGHTCVGLTGTCQTPADSDGDGYSDLLEARNLAAGFDPNDPKKPFQACLARGDADGDGLRDCEELFLKTDPRLFDSDADRIPDLLELINGLDPTDPTDAQADDDHDGIRNIDEIRNHTNPQMAPPPDSATDNLYRYDITESQTKPDGSVCYHMVASNIQLTTTGGGSDSMLGRNRLMLYFNQAPPDRPLDYGDLRVACVDVRYVDGVVKSPASGVVHLTDSQLKAAAQFKAATDCIDLTAGASMASPDGGSGP